MASYIKLQLPISSPSWRWSPPRPEVAATSPLSLTETAFPQGVWQKQAPGSTQPGAFLFAQITSRAKDQFNPSA
jgi:hypothetical protein